MKFFLTFASLMATIGLAVCTFQLDSELKATQLDLYNTNCSLRALERYVDDVKEGLPERVAYSFMTQHALECYK